MWTRLRVVSSDIAFEVARRLTAAGCRDFIADLQRELRRAGAAAGTQNDVAARGVQPIGRFRVGAPSRMALGLWKMLTAFHSACGVESRRAEAARGVAPRIAHSASAT